MVNAEQKIANLYQSYKGILPEAVIQLPQSGSNRLYFRVEGNNETIIGTYNLNIQENKTFIYFSDHFRNSDIPVPAILAVSEECDAYLQEDLGSTSLLNILEEEGKSDHVFSLYCKSLRQLSRMQITGNNGLDYSYSLTSREFGKQAILSDLLYFKYYFLDTLQLPYDKQLLLDDFESLGNFLTDTAHKYFLFRDFQSRNIIVKDDEIFFIDYQGGMSGALQYDVASLLWQAKAGLSDDWKSRLLSYYLDFVDELLDHPVDREKFINQYHGYVLIRLLQVLGAYGFRGLFERKAHFLTSIPLALNNLKFFVGNFGIGSDFPQLEMLLKRITDIDIVQRFQPVQATADSPLVVDICSFSYKKGIPVDDSGNGGGFVFDCRGILNPGRFDEYKTLCGKETPVKDFLEQKTQMNNFLNGVYNVVGITVEDYIKRGFKHLSVNFGCTGGQHRSVYAAEQTARFLRNKYHVNVRVQHLNENCWVRETEAI